MALSGSPALILSRNFRMSRNLRMSRIFRMSREIRIIQGRNLRIVWPRSEFSNNPCGRIVIFEWAQSSGRNFRIMLEYSALIFEWGQILSLNFRIMTGSSALIFEWIQIWSRNFRIMA